MQKVECGVEMRASYAEVGTGCPCICSSGSIIADIGWGNESWCGCECDHGTENLNANCNMASAWPV